MLRASAFRDHVSWDLVYFTASEVALAKALWEFHKNAEEFGFEFLFPEALCEFCEKVEKLT